MSAPDAVGIEALIAVPSFEEEGAFTLAALALPRCDQAHDLVPQHQQPGRVFTQQLAKLLHRAVVGLIAPQYRGARRQFAVRAQLPCDCGRVALARLPCFLVDAPLNRVLLRVKYDLFSRIVGQGRAMFFHRFGD